MFMRLFYTDHVLDRMSERGIKKKNIEKCIKRNLFIKQGRKRIYTNGFISVVFIDNYIVTTYKV